MLKDKNILLIVIIIAAINIEITSEVLVRDAEVVEELNGQSVINLYSGQYINSEFPEKEYVQFMIEFFIKRPVYEDELIKMGTILYDESGKKIGKVLKSFNALLSEEFKEGKTLVYFRGYIPIDAIDSSSIAENYINSLITQSQYPILKKNLEHSLIDLGFRDWTNYDSFSSKVKFGSELISSPSHRVLVVFYSNKVFAIVHSGNITQINKDSLLKKKHKIIQYFNNDKELQNKFENGFFYQYISAG